MTQKQQLPTKDVYMEDLVTMGSVTMVLEAIMEVTMEMGTILSTMAAIMMEDIMNTTSTLEVDAHHHLTETCLRSWPGRRCW